MTAGPIREVYVRRGPFWRLPLHVSLILGVITLWLGLTRAWFGGSWIADLFGLVLGLLVLTALPKRVGAQVRMTPAGIKAWADAGCPDRWPAEGAAS